MNKSSNTMGAIYITIAAVSWGVFPLFNRTLASLGIPPLASTAVRAMIAAVIYIIWGISKGSFKTFSIKCIPFYLFYGVVAIVGTTYLYAQSQVTLNSSSMAAVLLYTAPAFVIIFNRILYKEPVTKTKLIALFLTFTGCFLVSGGYDISNLKVNGLGLAIGLLSGLSYSMLTVIGKTAVKKYSQDLNSFMPTIMAAIVFMCMVPPWKIPVPHISVVIMYLLLSLTGTVIPYVFYAKGLSTGMDGGRAILIANVEPIVASVLGVIVFNDTISIIQIFGIILTLTGAVIASLSK